MSGMFNVLSVSTVLSRTCPVVSLEHLQTPPAGDGLMGFRLLRHSTDMAFVRFSSFLPSEACSGAGARVPEGSGCRIFSSCSDMIRIRTRASLWDGGARAVIRAVAGTV